MTHSDFQKFLAALGVALLPAVSASQHALAETVRPSVIYGEDDRKDLYQVDNSMHLKLADSTVALFFNESVEHDPLTGLATLTTNSFASEFMLCKDEPFREQPSGAFCSGSLVGEDLVLTAGHCVETKKDCEQTSFVFGFAIHEEGAEPSAVPSSEVYACKELIRSEVEDAGADYALIRLDRKVPNHAPLAINRGGKIDQGTPVTVIGHPSGLPTKVAGGAQVRDASKEGYFVANLDTYGGNSGSAVFNDVTGEIEGILVRGERDFMYQNGCYLSYRCPDDGCRGEDVTKISAVSSLIPE